VKLNLTALGVGLGPVDPFGALTVCQLTGIGADLLPRMDEFKRLPDAMASARSAVHANADKIKRRW